MEEDSEANAFINHTELAVHNESEQTEELKGDSSPRRTRKNNAPPSPRRPFTRSQTSNNKAADSPVIDAVAIDKPEASSSKRTLDEVDAPEKRTRKPSAPKAMSSSSTRLTGSHSLPGQYTFLAASPSTTVFERRGPRTRTAQPVPVPNLTKKSRGRRVPTKNGEGVEEEEAQAPSQHRLYVCKVEGCGKCFNRGEHLKRHIRSIHTHEKPFKCTHPDCNRHFNRHDNLLQHQKVHKDLGSNPQINMTHDPPQPSRGSGSASQSPIGHYEHVFRGAPPRSSLVVPAAPYNTFAPYQPGPSSPVGFATNMAVSSLRTELPPPMDAPPNGDPRYYHQQSFGSESPPLQRAFIDPQLRMSGHPHIVDTEHRESFYP